MRNQSPNHLASASRTSYASVLPRDDQLDVSPPAIRLTQDMPRGQMRPLEAHGAQQARDGSRTSRPLRSRPLAGGASATITWASRARRRPFRVQARWSAAAPSTTARMPACSRSAAATRRRMPLPSAASVSAAPAETVPGFAIEALHCGAAWRDPPGLLPEFATSRNQWQTPNPPYKQEVAGCPAPPIDGM